MTGGIGAAFLTAAAIAVIAGMIALVVLPAASNFVPALRFAPRVSIH
jgi:hypothetical protein